MHLTALVQSPEHVCCRYRLAAFRSFLEEAGHTLELRSFPRNPWAWFRLSRSLDPSGAVIVQRKLLHAWQLYLLRRASSFLMFDFDDAVFLRDSYSVKGIHSGSRRRRFAAMVRTADAVVAGNVFLRDQAIPWSAGNRVAVIPTCVDPNCYPMAKHHNRGQNVELVWIGSSSTLQGLERIQPWLEEIGQRRPDLRLKLVCDRFLRLRHLPVVECPWSEAGEAEALASADIGISWIPDDPWSRGKCGLKVLQYLSAGLPVVANPVGVQTAMVRHGETGFLAETPQEWWDAIRRLADDPALRRRMGQAGRQLVEREYSVEVGAIRWLTLLDRLQRGMALTG